ncbi:TGACG-sequence-specific DNA-binding protein TGA-2.1-like [Rutidosis leptorrhynchoides]|uniref:TGACG-sequence-specific DNA-binding protein TGA-2.1-like n=1 Tax=Rutidosis leptorrhynchoides TaxID=125765 RepID=UPI003A98D22B
MVPSSFLGDFPGSKNAQELMPADKTIIFPACTETDSINFSELYKSLFNVHNNLISHLRTAMLSNQTDTELHPIILTVFDHIKKMCMMWLGGFRPSDIVNLLVVHLELTSEQKKHFISLKTSTLNQETNLSMRVTEIQSSLSKVFIRESFVQTGDESYYNKYTSQMHFSIRKLHVMEDIMLQSQRLLDEIYRCLITKQFAMPLLAFNDYLNRITALSFLWISRQKY